MDLGNVFTIPQFNKNEHTTWIIDKVHRGIYPGEVYDTVKLGWVLSIIEKETIFPISFFIKDYVSNCNRLCDEHKFDRRVCGTTFSVLKKKYVGRGFNASECTKDVLLNKVYSAFLVSQAKERETFIELESAYCFKAQSSFAHESDGFGRSGCYYIVGISVGKPFEKPML